MGAYYGPLTVVWIFVRSPSKRASAVLLLHSVVVGAVEVVWNFMSGVPEFVKVAAVALYEIWLIPVYLIIEPSGMVRLMLSVVLGGTSWWLITWNVARYSANTDKDRQSPRMSIDKTSSDPHFSLRALLFVLVFAGVIFGLASLVRNLVWWLLVVLAFYGPFTLCCIYIRRSIPLALAVVALHSAVILLIPVAFLLAFGNIDDLAHAAAIAFIDAPLMPLYLALDAGPQVLAPLSLSLGNALFAFIALALRRLRGGQNPRAAEKTSHDCEHPIRREQSLFRPLE